MNDQNNINNTTLSTDMLVHAFANNNKLKQEELVYFDKNNNIATEINEVENNKDISESYDNNKQYSDNIEYYMDDPVKNVSSHSNNEEIKDTQDRHEQRQKETNNETKNNEPSGGSNFFSRGDSKSNIPPEDLILLKFDMLKKLCELQKNGTKLSQNYTLKSDYETMKYEYRLHSSMRSKHNMISVGTDILVRVATFIEFLNEKYDPFSFELTGWANRINDDLHSYYEVLGELYDKYGGSEKSMAPEFKLLGLLTLSATKYHMTNLMIKSLTSTFSTDVKEDKNLFEKLRRDAFKENEEKRKTKLENEKEKNNDENLNKLSDLAFIKQKELEQIRKQKKIIEDEISNESIRKKVNDLSLNLNKRSEIHETESSASSVHEDTISRLEKQLKSMNSKRSDKHSKGNIAEESQRGKNSKKNIANIDSKNSKIKYPELNMKLLNELNEIDFIKKNLNKTDKSDEIAMANKILNESDLSESCDTSVSSSKSASRSSIKDSLGSSSKYSDKNTRESSASKKKGKIVYL